MKQCGKLPRPRILLFLSGLLVLCIAIDTAIATDSFSLMQSLTGVNYSDAAWGDIDNDGDLDLVLCGESNSGQAITLTYMNNSGTLVQRQSLIGIYVSGSNGLAWGDYDNDGDLDLALAGRDSQSPTTRIYTNDGTGGLTPDAGQVLPELYGASVAWGDADRDGDLDLYLQGLVQSGGPAAAVLCLNDGSGNLSPAPCTSLFGYYSGSAIWGDFDNDGDLDLIAMGGDPYSPVYCVMYYINDPTGILTADGSHGLIGGALAEIAAGDYDNDGDLDVALTGCTAYGGLNVARIYQNDGSGQFTLFAHLMNIYRSTCAWGDYDNDGDLDVVFGGCDNGGPLSARIYRNTGTSFTSTGYSFPAIDDGAFSWADVDGDGHLDFFLTGAYRYVPYTYANLYRRHGDAVNTAPSIPTTLAGIETPDGLRLAWGGAVDAQTPQTGLYYALRVGTTPGGQDVMSGACGTPRMGNVGQAEEITLHVPSGVYYWSVRSVDTGFMASAWAEEQVVEVLNDHLWEPPESYITGGVTESTEPIGGVMIDLYDADLNLLGSQTTDPQSGTYAFVGTCGDYTVQLVPPLGYKAVEGTSVSVDVTLGYGDEAVVDFQLERVVAEAEARSHGYWKHQYKAHESGNGHAQESLNDLLSYHQGIYDHFYARLDEYAIQLQGVTHSAGTTLTFSDAMAALSTRGDAPMIERTAREFLALLLNVISGKIGNYHEASVDGATVSQVVTYVADLIEDGDPANDELACNLASWVNGNEMVAEGIVPLDTPDIAYRRPGAASAAVSWCAQPNPSRDGMELSYSVPPGGAAVALDIFDVAGRRVRALVERHQAAGRQTVRWLGDDEAGRRLAAGVYCCRLRVGGWSDTRTIVLMP